VPRDPELVSAGVYQSVQVQSQVTWEIELIERQTLIDVVGLCPVMNPQAGTASEGTPVDFG